jgi:hypothetical protein
MNVIAIAPSKINVAPIRTGLNIYEREKAYELLSDGGGGAVYVPS